MKIHLSPGERNPIEGKFGQAKVAYGLNKISAKLPSTSTSWIAAIALVLNLVKLTRKALVSPILSLKNILENLYRRIINICSVYNMIKSVSSSY